MSDETKRRDEARKRLGYLAGLPIRFVVDEGEINDVTIVRPDNTRHGCFVGPLATIPIGSSNENDEGDEVLDLEGEDGLILYAVAALPFFAELVCWVNTELDEIADGRIPPKFISGLRQRTKWLLELIDDRDESVGVGTHGFHKYK